MRLFIFLILFIRVFADDYKILQLDLNVLKNKLEKIESEKDLSYSQKSYLELKKDYILKNIELTEEKIKVISEYYKSIFRLQEIEDLNELSKAKLDYFNSINSNQKELKSLSQEDIFKNEILIQQEILQQNLYEKEKIYLNFILSNNNFNIIDRNTFSYLKELKSAYQFYIELKKQELNLYIVEKNGNRDLNIKKLELSYIEELYLNKINGFKKYNINLKNEVFRIENNLKILNKKIIYFEEKQINLKELLSQGLVSKKNFLDKQIELFELKQEKITLTGAYKYLIEEIKFREDETFEK